MGGRQPGGWVRCQSMVRCPQMVRPPLRVTPRHRQDGTFEAMIAALASCQMEPTRARQQAPGERSFSSASACRGQGSCQSMFLLNPRRSLSPLGTAWQPQPQPTLLSSLGTTWSKTMRLRATLPCSALDGSLSCSCCFAGVRSVRSASSRTLCVYITGLIPLAGRPVFAVNACISCL